MYTIFEMEKIRIIFILFINVSNSSSITSSFYKESSGQQYEDELTPPPLNKNYHKKKTSNIVNPVFISDIDQYNFYLDPDRGKADPDPNRLWIRPRRKAHYFFFQSKIINLILKTMIFCCILLFICIYQLKKLFIFKIKNDMIFL